MVDVGKGSGLVVQVCVQLFVGFVPGWFVGLFLHLFLGLFLFFLVCSRLVSCVSWVFRVFPIENLVVFSTSPWKVDFLGLCWRLFFGLSLGLSWLGFCWSCLWGVRFSWSFSVGGGVVFEISLEREREGEEGYWVLPSCVCSGAHIVRQC